jgi:hypothetical protein
MGYLSVCIEQRPRELPGEMLASADIIDRMELAISPS